MSLSNLETGGSECVTLNRVWQYRLICTVLEFPTVLQGVRLGGNF